MSVELIALIGTLTFLLRSSCMLGPRPLILLRLRPLLARLPAAVLPVLAASSLMGSVQDFSWRLAGVLMAALVTWRTKNLVLAMALGFAVFWARRFF